MRSGPASQVGDDVSGRWRWVWRLNVAPKIRVFAWRLFYDILPSRVNLISRHVDVEPFCPRCGSEIETMEHALRDCQWVHDFWELVPALGVAAASEESLYDWVYRIATSFRHDLQSLFLTYLWNLWFARNNLIFQNKVLTQDQVLSSSQRLSEIFMEINARKLKGMSRSGEAKWAPSEGEAFKLNTDAGFRCGFGNSLDGILRRCDGSLVWCFAQPSRCEFSVEIVEALAVKRGLELAIQHGITDLVDEMDSQIVFHALCRPKEDWSYFGNIVDDILQLAVRINRVHYSWVRRPANSVDHCLAQFAFHCDVPFYSDVIPDVIVHNFVADFPAF